MTDKPRKRSTQERIDDAVADAVADAMANLVINGGTYGDEAEVPPAPEAQVKREAGRPPVHDWTRIHVVLDWFLSDPNIQKLLPQVEFIMFVRNWYRLETGGKAPPHHETIEARLRERPNYRRK
jgi:hypothetical protein